MLRNTGLGCGLLILLCWTTSCRGERAAFRFQEVMTQAAVTAPDTTGSRKARDDAYSAGRLSLNAPVASSFPVLKRERQRNPLSRRTISHRANTTARGQQLFPQLKLQSHPPAGMAPKAKEQIDDSSWDSILFLLGGVICVAAVIMGLKLGGGLGWLIGIPVYTVGAYVIARGYGGTNKPASTSSFSSLKGLRRKLRIVGGRQQPKLSHSLASAKDLGETAFIVGNLMLIAALILGLTGVLSGNAALLLGVVSFLLAIAAYNGFKW